MKVAGIWLAIVLIALVVQSTIFSFFSYHGVRPDLLLVLVVSFGLLSGKEKGLGLGFFAGLMQDLAFGNLFGLSLITKMTIGYFFGLAERKVFKESILLPVTAVAVATALSGVLSVLLLTLLGARVEIAVMAVHTFLPLLVGNILIAVPVHWFVYRLNAVLTDLL